MSDERQNIDLKTLVGEHELSGVDGDTIQVKRWYSGDETEPAEALRFVLDGVTYEGIESPDDGYRNSMEGLYVTETPVRNAFAPVRVVGRYRDKGEYSGTDDVLELIDVANGAVILEIGTENVDDYYPGFCAHWHPERMAVNKPLAQD
jgi:hypothetical protein